MNHMYHYELVSELKDRMKDLRYNAEIFKRLIHHSDCPSQEWFDGLINCAFVEVGLLGDSLRIHVEQFRCQADRASWSLAVVSELNIRTESCGGLIDQVSAGVFNSLDWLRDPIDSQKVKRKPDAQRLESTKQLLSSLQLRLLDCLNVLQAVVLEYETVFGLADNKI